MLEFDPSCRPLTERIAKHPFFWSKKYLLSFLSEISDVLESFAIDDPIFVNLEKNGESVVGIASNPSIIMKLSTTHNAKLISTLKSIDADYNKIVGIDDNAGIIRKKIAI